MRIKIESKLIEDRYSFQLNINAQKSKLLKVYYFKFEFFLETLNFILFEVKINCTWGFEVWAI